MSNNALFASLAVFAVIAAGICGMAIISEESDAVTYTVEENGRYVLHPGDSFTFKVNALDGDLDIKTISPLLSNKVHFTYESDLDLKSITVNLFGSCPVGTYEFVIADIDGGTGEEFTVYSPITIVVESGEGDLSFTSPEAVDAISGSAISYQATTNVDGVTFSKDGGNATWLTVTSAGKLTGTAPSVITETDYTFGIKATTPGGQTLTQTVTFTVFPVAKLTATSSNVSGTVGDAISTVTITSNLNGTFSVKSGELPAGVNYSKSGDKAITITGTPTSVGSSTVVFSCISLEGPSQTATINLPPRC